MSRIVIKTNNEPSYLDSYECDGCGHKISTTIDGNNLPENWFEDEYRNELYCKECFEEKYNICSICGEVDKNKFFYTVGEFGEAICEACFENEKEKE